MMPNGSIELGPQEEPDVPKISLDNSAPAGMLVIADYVYGEGNLV
jgi:hypothetical protein